jgi:hypothetical protein
VTVIGEKAADVVTDHEDHHDVAAGGDRPLSVIASASVPQSALADDAGRNVEFVQRFLVRCHPPTVPQSFPRCDERRWGIL